MLYIRSSARRANGRPRAGFTITELLVTVAVIALLAALLLPALSSVRLRGGAAASLSNARSLAVIMLTATADRDNELPRSTHSFFAFQRDGAVPWYRTAFEYGSGDEYRPRSAGFHAFVDSVLRSPLDPRTSGADPSPFAPEYNGSYAINVYYELSDVETPSGRTWRRLERVPRHDASVFFTETPEGDTTGGMFTRGRDHVMAHFWLLGAPPSDEVATERNRPGCAFAFLDGGARNLTIHDVWRHEDPGGFATPDIDRFNPETAR